MPVAGWAYSKRRSWASWHRRRTAGPDRRRRRSPAPAPESRIDQGVELVQRARGRADPHRGHFHDFGGRREQPGCLDVHGRERDCGQGGVFVVLLDGLQGKASGTGGQFAQPDDQVTGSVLSAPAHPNRAESWVSHPDLSGPTHSAHSRPKTDGDFQCSVEVHSSGDLHDYSPCVLQAQTDSRSTPASGGQFDSAEGRSVSDRSQSRRCAKQKCRIAKCRREKLYGRMRQVLGRATSRFRECYSTERC